MLDQKGTILVVGVIALLAAGGFFYISREPQENTQTYTPPMEETTGLHWHPTLEIWINDEPYIVPANIGITVGNNIDHDVSGMHMSPVHTHDFSGVLHMEQVSPNEETKKFGYFFMVWEKQFTNKCILDWCNEDGKIVKMYVNGVRNYEFGEYSMKDEDAIVIRYEEDSNDHVAPAETV